MLPGVVGVPEKVPFAIDTAVALLRTAVAPLPKAVLFQLADEGYSAPFEQLLACMISIRTREETTLPIARRLLAVARTPAQIAVLPMEELDALIRACSFHEAKAAQFKAIAARLVAEHGGVLPCDRALLLSLPGVGPKCANLVLGIACGQPQIGVDIHVHRVTNRWGYVAAATPEKTMAALERVLPRAYWVEINRLLVPFGKYVCTGDLPRCGACPLLAMCPQVGVLAHR